MAYAIGYWFGFTAIPALFFIKSAKKHGALNGRIHSSIILLICLPLAGFFHLSGVILFKKRKNNIGQFTKEQIDEQYKKGWISQVEYDEISTKYDKIDDVSSTDTRKL